jgi:predicted PurR-regulated permease PerM
MDWEIALVAAFAFVVAVLFVIGLLYLGMTIKKDEPGASQTDNTASSTVPAPEKDERKKPPSTGTTLIIIAVCFVVALSVFVIPLVTQFRNLLKLIPPWW